MPNFPPNWEDNYSPEPDFWANDGEPDIGLPLPAGPAHAGQQATNGHQQSPNGTDKGDELDLGELVKAAQIPIEVPTLDVPYVKPIALGEVIPPINAKTVVGFMYQGDFGDAMLLKEMYQGRLCRDTSAKKVDEGWYVWGGHHWREDRGVIPLLIPTKLAAQYLTAQAAIQGQLETPPKDNPFTSLVSADNWDDDKSFRKELKTIAKALGKKATGLSYAGKLNPIFRFAGYLMPASNPSDPHSSLDVWDSNTWLLPVENGVIGLRDGQAFFRNGQPSDYVRTHAPVKWQGIDAPDAGGFEKFLSEVLEGAANHAETVDYTQRMLGYSILGSAHENNFAILYGDRGQNGKGTLFKILGKVLGGLCGSVSEDVFLSKKRGNAGSASPHLMTLRGLRVAWCAETDEGERLNGSQVKRLTGNEPLRGRALNQNEIEWEPTHTLFLMTNNKPHVNAEDNALWLRIALLPFLISFVKNPTLPHERKANPHLLERMTTPEAKSGILALLVKWCLRYQKEGLALPKSLQTELESYRADEDTLGHFISECCFVGEVGKVKAKDLYTAYATWASEGGSKPMSNNAFGRRVNKRFKRKRTSKGQVYSGIGLLTQETSDKEKGIF
jgi:putative DNA primase/helicase